MTSTEPALCTSAPTTGLRTPVIASTMAAKLSAMEKVMFRRMVRIMRFDRRRRCGISRMSSLTKAMSAASTAISLAHAAHSYAHVGALERRCVVDAVADHAHLLAGLLACVDIGEFILRETAGAVFADADAGGDGRGGIFVIAREQHRLRSGGAHALYGVARVGTQRVGKGDEAREGAVHGDVDNAASPAAVFAGALLRLRGERDAFLRHQLRVARGHAPVRHLRAHAAAGEHGKILGAGGSLPVSSRRPRTTALPSGCSERNSAPAARAYSSSRGSPGRALTTAATCGAP